MALKDWYRGLLRFVPKTMHGKFNVNEHLKNFPTLGIIDKEQQKQLSKILGTRINNIAHFEQAFTHRSYTYVLRNSGCIVNSNERMEFLGDAVLELIVTDYLFNFFPDMQEGELTKLRARLVNKKTLAFVANQIGLQNFIKISFGTEKNFDKAKETIIADVFEALIAAIYIDSGIEKTVAFIYKYLLPLIDTEVMEDTNYKSKLLEIVQKVGRTPPTYQVIEAIGPDHNKYYTIGVFVDDILIGTGKGWSKKDGEQDAAKNAIEVLVNKK